MDDNEVSLLPGRGGDLVRWVLFQMPALVRVDLGGRWPKVTRVVVAHDPGDIAEATDQQGRSMVVDDSFGRVDPDEDAARRAVRVARRRDRWPVPFISSATDEWQFGPDPRRDPVYYVGLGREQAAERRRMKVRRQFEKHLHDEDLPWTPVARDHEHGGPDVWGSVDVSFSMTAAIGCEDCDDDLVVDLVDEHGWGSLRLQSAEQLRQLAVAEAEGDLWTFPDGPDSYALCPECSDEA